jgi:hypothetical protein
LLARESAPIADCASATCRDVDAAGPYRSPGYATHRTKAAKSLASGVESQGGLLTYTGGWLDRAAGRGADAQWLGELVNSPDTTLIPR